MAIKGKTVMVDIGQLNQFSGTINQASWEVLNTSNGAIEEMTADQIAGTGGPSVFFQFYPSAYSDTIEIPALAGVNVKMIYRGVPWELIKTGLPVDFQVKADIVTNPSALIISVFASEFTEFQQGELITIEYSLI